MLEKMTEADMVMNAPVKKLKKKKFRDRSSWRNSIYVVANNRQQPHGTKSI